jgi:hypothetical protein
MTEETGNTMPGGVSQLMGNGELTMMQNVWIEPGRPMQFSRNPPC